MRVLRARVCDRHMCLCTTQERLFLKIAATGRLMTRCMQKERLELVKVRLMLAIERPPSLCTTAHDRVHNSS